MYKRQDYDGDGKIESGKEEYFGSKDKAIKKALRKEDAQYGYDKKGRSLNPKDKKKVKEDVQHIDEEPISLTLAALGAKAAAAAGAAKAGGAALAAKGAMAAKGGVGAVKAGGLASKASKAVDVANKVSTAGEVAGALTGGGQPKKKQADMQPNVGTVAAGHELDGDVLKELQDAGLFSEEEIKSLTEISADLALKASKGADVARGKLAAAGDKEGAKAKASQASRLYAASGEKRKKEPVAIPDRSYPKGKGANYQEK